MKSALNLKVACRRGTSIHLTNQIDASAGNRCPETGKGSEVSKRAVKEQHKGITATPVKKTFSSGNQIKCLYAKIGSMWNKQEELEMCIHLQGYWHHKDMVG